MKKLLLSLSMLFTILLNAHSQSFWALYMPITEFSKDKPFNAAPTEPFSQIRLKDCKVHMEYYDKSSSLEYEKDVYCYTSNDGLSDTITYGDYSKNYAETRTYFPDGKMASCKTLDFYKPEPTEDIWMFNDTYTYDEKGRILEIQSSSVYPTSRESKRFYYTNSSRDSSVLYHEINGEWIPYTKTIVSYIDSGYIKDFFVYDKKSHTYYHSLYSVPETYIFDSDGRIIRRTDLFSYYYYEYFDNGYREISCSDGKINGKTEHFFNDDNELMKEVFYRRSENETWDLSSSIEYTYFYGLPTSNKEINEPARIYGSDGQIIIESDIRTTASVYSISGSLMKQINISTGINQISMISGIYIVSINGKSYKIHVK